MIQARNLNNSNEQLRQNFPVNSVWKICNNYEMILSKNTALLLSYLIQTIFHKNNHNRGWHHGTVSQGTTCDTRIPCQCLLESCLLLLSPTSCMPKQWRMHQVLKPLHPHGRPQSSFLLASPWSNPSQIKSMSLSLSFCLSHKDQDEEKGKGL